MRTSKSQVASRSDACYWFRVHNVFRVADGVCQLRLCSVRHGLCSPCDRERGPRRRGGAVSGRPSRRVSAADRGPRAARVRLRPASTTARGHTLADFERLVPAGAKRCSCRRWSASVAFRERPYARLICAKAKPESRVFAPRSMRDNCDQPRSRERRRSFPGSLQGGEMIYTGAATTP